MIIDYKKAGVDIDEGNLLVEYIKPIAKATQIPGVLEGLGGFGAMFELPITEYKKPVLVSGTDGIGTKLKIAFKEEDNSTIGIDLVAMCVNDLIVTGAKPLFFLDYYATGSLNAIKSVSLIQGIANGCKMASCALVGGETAEMPGLYNKNEYDLAGFCVGIVDKDKIINKTLIRPGDQLIALSSSGLHSNGYSLVNKIIELKNINLKQPFGESTLGKVLLTPTKIYVKLILQLIKKFDIHGISHITGGGFTENIPRVLPDYTKAVINLDSWELPDIFKWIKKESNIPLFDLLRTFNCGAGMILVVPKTQYKDILAYISSLDENAWHIGFIKETENKNSFVDYDDI